MKTEDKKYLCQTIGNLTGLPIRLYQKEKMKLYYSAIPFIKDPVCLVEKELLQITDEISYYITNDFLYYGVLTTPKEKILLGPCSEVPLSKDILRNMAFSMNLTCQDAEDFLHAMQSLPPMPFRSVLQILCALYFGITGEKKTLKDIAIHEDAQTAIQTETFNQQSEKKAFSDASEQTHSSFAIEQALMDFVRQGNLSALNEWMQNVPSVRTGILAPNQLRQIKNTFIVAATLVSRAAIEGGLDIENALTLSDLYIQKCETLNSVDRITNLQYHMVLDFTSQVESLRLGDSPSALVLKVSNYVHNHITETISTDDVAKAVYLSRSYLSTTFKKETGVSLADYIAATKIEEAKRLLSATDKTIAEISSFLAFSSQSHFTNTFKKFEGVTPSAYSRYHR